jgi:hypothetical protein
MALIAGMTSGEIQILQNANRNGIIIFLVVFFICLRNIGLKRLHNEGLVIRVRRSVAIPYTATVLSVGVLLSAFHLTYWALPVMFGLISIFASVTMLYITSSLLERFSLVTVSVIGLVSQICVNVLCIPVEHAHNVIISLVGGLLLMCVIIIYFKTSSTELIENIPTTGKWSI